MLRGLLFFTSKKKKLKLKEHTLCSLCDAFAFISSLVLVLLVWQAAGGEGSRAGLLMPSRFTDEDTEAGEG